MWVLGADENGLGPKLGPLVVSGVVLEDGNLPSEVLVDSKRVFRRSAPSYAVGESLALGILAEALGFTPGDTEELREALGISAELGKRPIPVWAREAKGEFGVRWVRVVTFGPKQINKANKFELVRETFLKFLREAPWDEAILGKVGSRKRYGLFWAQTLVEGRDKSVYLWQGKKIGFYRDAERFSAVAAASLVGKYIRELAMLHLNEVLGFNSEIPWCSGYPSDRKLGLLVAKIKRLGLWEDLVRER